jgi:hypothetical protein
VEQEEAASGITASTVGGVVPVQQHNPLVMMSVTPQQRTITLVLRNTPS